MLQYNILAPLIWYARTIRTIRLYAEPLVLPPNTGNSVILVPKVPWRTHPLLLPAMPEWSLGRSTETHCSGDSRHDSNVIQPYAYLHCYRIPGMFLLYRPLHHSGQIRHRPASFDKVAEASN